MLTMTRIPVPAWAPADAQHVIKTVGDSGELAKQAIMPHLPQIYEELHHMVNEFVNDPEQCFIDAGDFPLQSKLDGRYYIASEAYEGIADDEPFNLWLELRCVEKGHGGNEACDYLGLEMVVTVDCEGACFEFDDGFNTSSL